MNQDEYLSITAAARRIGCSRPKLSRLVAAGAVPFYRIATDGRVRLVRAEDVDRLLVPRPRGGEVTAA
jgi:excisionase family DNA binding protein